MRFCKTSGLIRSSGFLLTPRTGVFKKISLIVVSLSIKHYRTDIISFSLGVIRYAILDEIGKIAHVISFQILRQLLNDTTVGDISLKRPGCGVNKQLSKKYCSH